MPCRQTGESSGHFFYRVGVTCASCRLDPSSQGLARFGVPRKTHVKLAKLEISGDIIRVSAKECVEVHDGGFGIALIAALDGEAIEREGVAGMGCDELLQFLAACFCWLWLGHGVRGSIICA